MYFQFFWFDSCHIEALGTNNIFVIFILKYYKSWNEICVQKCKAIFHHHLIMEVSLHLLWLKLMWCVPESHRLINFVHVAFDSLCACVGVSVCMRDRERELCFLFWVHQQISKRKDKPMNSEPHWNSISISHNVWTVQRYTTRFSMVHF